MHLKPKDSYIPDPDRLKWSYNTILQLSGEHIDVPLEIRIRPASKTKCPRCWTYNRVEGEDLCPRCANAIQIVKA